MPDYAKTLIYKLINYDCPDLIYVGSTTNFTKRKQAHKERCLNTKSKKNNIKVYKTIRENGGWENWNMIKICDFPCSDRREAEKEEDRYMLELNSTLHMRRPFQTIETRKDYFDGRKDIKKEYDKIRRQENSEEIKAKKREAYYKNKEKNSVPVQCECGAIVKKSYFNIHKNNNIHLEKMKLKT